MQTKVAIKACTRRYLDSTFGNLLMVISFVQPHKVHHW
ncbi:hypothetical protein NB311A_19961 [Nitrobacter sp. Nb-311A]|nr:hypothetical protein NB311A_19961 [Nitrobacter sp. Nb-311A]